LNDCKYTINVDYLLDAAFRLVSNQSRL